MKKTPNGCHEEKYPNAFNSSFLDFTRLAVSSSLRINKEWDYNRFQRELIMLLAASLSRKDVSKNTSAKLEELHNLLNSVDSIQTFFKNRREKIEKEFGKISDVQFFTAIFGARMGFGEPGEIYRTCFDEYARQVEDISLLNNYRYTWDNPPDLSSNVKMAGHYLITQEIIQIGNLLLAEFANNLFASEKLIKEFLFRLISKNKSLEYHLREKTVINRWNQAKDSLIPAFDAIIPQSNFRESENKVLYASRMAYLLTKGTGEPINFAKQIHKGFYFIEKQEMFLKMLVDAVYNKYTRQVLIMNIKNLIHTNFQDSWSFKAPDNLVDPVFRVVKARFDDIDILIDKTTRECLRIRNVEDSSILNQALVSSVKSTRNILKFLQPSMKEKQVKVILTRYYDLVNQILEIVTREQREIANIEQERLREQRKSSIPYIISELLEKTDQKLDLVPIIHGLAYKKLGKIEKKTGHLKPDEVEIIKRGSTFIAFNVLAHLDEPDKERIMLVVFDYLIDLNRDVKALNKEFTLLKYIKAEITLLTDIVSINDTLLGSLSKHWTEINPEQGVSGIITYEISCLLRKWILLPKKHIIEQDVEISHADIARVTRRDDIRNFALLAWLRILEYRNHAEAWRIVNQKLPQPIIPSRNSLFADAFMIKDELKFNM